jgi:aryl-alcohol dehydrogenase (NADP+)
MDQVRLGASGLNVSRLCLGCMTFGTPSWRPWVLDEAASRPIIARALELGVTFFDTADMYSLGQGEQVLGRALRDFARRSDVVIATKLYYPMSDKPNDRGLSRAHIMDSIDRSLRNLGTDYVDLYQIHAFDPETPIDETLQALDDVVRAGKARYLGASTMAAWQFAKLLFRAGERGWTRFSSMQNHYNLVYREEEREMIPMCRDQGIGVVPFSPLARGFLAGNRKRDGNQRGGDTTRARTDQFAQQDYYEEVDFRIVDRLRELAARRGVKPAQLALAWVAGRPGVTAPILGVSRVDQLEDAVTALSLRLSDEECRYLEEAYSARTPRG